VLPIQHVQDLGRKVKVARVPQRRSDALADTADHLTDLNSRDFARALLPDPVVPPKGSAIPCPYDWLSIEQKANRLTPGNRRRLLSIVNELGHSRRNLAHPIADDMFRSQSQSS
jgi:hypothetical protein